MLRNILIVAPFVSLPGEPYFNRFLYLAQMWSKEYSVTLVTSRFCHFLKSHRTPEDPRYRDLSFELVLLNEPGYRTNVSIGRFVSHYSFVSALRIWLEAQEGKRYFDIAYSAYPLIASNIVLADFRHRLGYKLIIDIQDVWPESISAAFPILNRFKWLLLPLSRKADSAYAAGDGLVAVSKTYLTRSRRKCPEKPGMVAYLGSDRALVDSIPAESLRSDGPHLIYLGTLSHSYDVATCVQGIKRLRQRYPNLKLHILGDGPQLAQIRSLAGEGVLFYGFVHYNRMVAIAKSCDLAINPIVKSAAQSVTNKISDYFTLGLPIINSQQNPEVVKLIDEAGGGQYEAGNIVSFCAVVEWFINRSDRDIIKERTRAMAVRLFDRGVTYPTITKFMQNIAKAD